MSPSRVNRARKNYSGGDIDKLNELVSQQPGAEHDACGLIMIAAEDGKPRADIIPDALTALGRMAHRAGTAADGETSDGAGLLFGLSQDFFKAEYQKISGAPSDHDVGVGQFFFPADSQRAEEIKRDIEEDLKDLGNIVWREVPTDDAQLGPIALSQKPAIWQAIIAPSGAIAAKDFENGLLRNMRKIGNRLEVTDPDAAVLSMSSQTIVYKYMVAPGKLGQFYPDLTSGEMITHVAVGHDRYSTNTTSKPSRAQPFASMAHNGEINSDNGNVLQAIGRYGDGVVPVSSSDSGHLDGILRHYRENGMSLLQAMRMTTSEVPDENMPPDHLKLARYLRAMEAPWSGPAGLLGTDGNMAIAKVDDNALRPVWVSRTRDGRLIAASEDGAVTVAPSELLERRILSPGEMVAVDLVSQEFLNNHAIAERLIAEIGLENLDIFDKALTNMAATSDAVTFGPAVMSEDDNENWIRTANAVGMTEEEQARVITIAALDGKEAVSSMGDDTPIAPFSKMRRPLYHFMHQLCAQVTNPPIDYLREPDAFSTRTWLGQRDPINGVVGPIYELDSPILTRHQFKTMKDHVGRDKVMVLDATFAPDGSETFLQALRRLQTEALKAVEEGFTHIEISHANVASNRVILNGAMAISAVHSSLLRRQKRQQVSLHLNAYDVWDSHSAAMAITCGADVVCPNFAEAMIAHHGGNAEHIQNFQKSLNSGLLKIMAKKGITDVNSYRGGYQLEIMGLGKKVTEEFMMGVPNVMGGFSAERINSWERKRHLAAYNANHAVMPDKGSLRQHSREEGDEPHGWNSAYFTRIQEAAYHGDYQAFQEACLVADSFPRKYDGTFPGDIPADLKADTARYNRPLHPRHMLQIKSDRAAIAIEEVESVESILRHFVIEAMSFGAVSEEAQQAIFEAAHHLGMIACGGEGGQLNEWKYKASQVQLASGRWGVTGDYLTGDYDGETHQFSAKEYQVKFGQGAKWGEGGQYPAEKNTERTARARYAPARTNLISPPPQHNQYSIEDTAQQCWNLKALNPDARISGKIVATSGVSTIAVGLVKGGFDIVLISGHSGGTGAAGDSSIHFTGMPSEMGLWLSHVDLQRNGLRDRAQLETDGMMRTPRDIMIAAALGADRVGFGTLALIAMGCDMQGQCDKNKCGRGLATQDETLREKFNATAQNLIHTFTFMAQGVREELARNGYKTWAEWRGSAPRVLSQIKSENTFWNAMDLDGLIQSPPVPAVNAALEGCAPCAAPANDNFTTVQAYQNHANPEDPLVIDLGEVTISERNIGTVLSGEIMRERKRGSNVANTVKVTIQSSGAAGQAWGCYVTDHMTLEHTGTTGGGTGEGLTGGTLVIKRPDNDDIPEYAPRAVCGGSALFGATSGEFFGDGGAGQRFAVCNRGATAVISGDVGPYACEYMTGGDVTLLGKLGAHAFAGMYGGIAFNYDPDQKNLDQADLQTVAAFRLGELTSHDGQYAMTPVMVHRLKDKLASRLHDYTERTEDFSFTDVKPQDFWVIVPKKESGLINLNDFEESPPEQEATAALALSTCGSGCATRCGNGARQYRDDRNPGDRTAKGFYQSPLSAMNFVL